MRIDVPVESNYSYFSRMMFWLQKRKHGSVFLPTKAWGLSPWLYAAFMFFNSVLTRKSSPINPALRALINTYISQLNHCAFCVDLNASFLEKLGITQNKIMSLADYNSSALFNEKEKLALSYAERMTKSSMQVDDDLFQALSRFFNQNGIIELTAMIAFQNLSSKFNAALSIEPQGFCSIHHK